MIQVSTNEPGLTIIRPAVERLTAANAKTFKDEMCALIDTGASQLIVDFEDVSFVDSSGLGALVGVLKRMGVKGELSICGLNQEVSQMFKICRMDLVFTIYEHLPQAIQKIEARS